MVLDEAAQRAWKRTVVQDAIARIAGVKKPPVADPAASPVGLGYRNKVEFSLGAGPSGRPAAGLRAVLGTAGCGYSDVVKATIFVTDLGNFARLNALYGEAMGEHRPARHIVPCSALLCPALPCSALRCLRLHVDVVQYHDAAAYFAKAVLELREALDDVAPEVRTDAG